MARTGSFAGFPFDPEVFAGYVDEKSYISTAILASGIIAEDPTINNLTGNEGNVGTLRLYRPMNAEESPALNYDGETDNTPVTTTGNKQTYMVIQRMKAWETQDFTRELTGADPLGNVAKKVDQFYAQTWQKTLIKILDGILGIADMASHKTDLSVSEGSVGDTNKIQANSLIELAQKANGDMASNYSIVFMHSAVYARLQSLQLIEYNKYTVGNALTQSVELPTFNGRIVVVCDFGTVDTSVEGFPKYNTYMVGAGAFLGGSKKLLRPYETSYDAETKGGVEKFYTKQAKVLHPNGLSFAVDNVEKESPTDAELASSENWTLKFNAKNVFVSKLVTNG